MRIVWMSHTFIVCLVISCQLGCDQLSEDSRGLAGGAAAIAAALGLSGTPEAPAFSPAAGTFTQGQTLTITSAGASSIRYTTDGSEPTASNGTLYAGPIAVRTGTVKAAAFSAGGNASATTAGAYRIRATSFDLVVRDFLQSHGDFEDFVGSDLGIVTANLGSDGTPVYASGGTTPTTSGAANFHHWFHDVSANVRLSVQLPISTSPTTCYYNSASFFPIDGLGQGNEAMAHNFFFTTHTRIGVLVEDGTVIAVQGDDDWWVFLNGKRAIDMGGVHGATSGSVTLDAGNRTTYALALGDIVRVDIFQAERHTTQSNFRISLSSDCFSLYD